MSQKHAVVIEGVVTNIMGWGNSLVKLVNGKTVVSKKLAKPNSSEAPLIKGERVTVGFATENYTQGIILSRAT